MTINCEDLIQGCILEDSAFTLLAHVQVNGADWTQAQVSTITYSVWNTNDQVTPVATGSVTVSASVFDTLQLDGRWPIDDNGYNFRHSIAASVPSAAGEYRVEYKVTLVSGSVFFLTPFVVTVHEIWAS